MNNDEIIKDLEELIEHLKSDDDVKFMFLFYVTKNHTYSRFATNCSKEEQMKHLFYIDSTMTSIKVDFNKAMKQIEPEEYSHHDHEKH